VTYPSIMSFCYSYLNIFNQFFSHCLKQLLVSKRYAFI